MRVFRIVTATVAAVVLLVGSSAAGELVKKFALTAHGGLANPVQYLAETDAGGYAKLGFDGGATAEYFFTENVSIGASFGYDRFSLDNDVLQEQGSGETYDGNWTILEFGVFGRFVFLPGQPVRPFVRLGAIIGMAELKQDISNGSTMEATLDVDPAPGGKIAGGAFYEVSPTVYLFGEVNWTALATDGTGADLTRGSSSMTGELTKHLQWVGANVGVTFLVGGK